MHQLCGNRQALDVLVKMADWVKFRIDRLSHEQHAEGAWATSTAA